MLRKRENERKRRKISHPKSHMASALTEITSSYSIQKKYVAQQQFASRQSHYGGLLVADLFWYRRNIEYVLNKCQQFAWIKQNIARRSFYPASTVARWQSLCVLCLTTYFEFHTQWQRAYMSLQSCRVRRSNGTLSRKTSRPICN